jgi:hypothetical protein
VVALPAPDATPPAGVAGYWTDGTTTVLAAAGAHGVRLFYARTGDEVTTNAYDEISALAVLFG